MIFDQLTGTAGNTSLVQAYYTEPWALLGYAHRGLGVAVKNELANGVPSETRAPAPYPGIYIENGVAFIFISGILGKHLRWQDVEHAGGYDSAILEWQFMELLGRADVHTIISVINCPGGRAVGLIDLAEVIQEVGASKRTIAFINTVAGSAGYAVAAAHNEVYGTGSSVVGAIGVYAPMVDDSERWKMNGDKLKLYRSAPGKGRGISGSAFTAEDDRFFQGRSDDLGARFEAFVRLVRPQVAEGALTGDYMSAFPEGVAAGLVDGTFPTLQHLLANLLTTSAA